jgi:ceramide kinase
MITMLAYGFFGNIIEQSDQWRIFGPLRYTLAGIFQFIRNTSYPTKLTIAQVPEKSSSKVTDDDHDRYSSDNSLKRKISDENSEAKTRKTSSLQIKREGQYRLINCLNMPCRCDKSKYGMSPSVHLGMRVI